MGGVVKKLILISFDAVGSDELAQLEQLPNFRRFTKEGKIFRDVESVFVSNTYPIHTSIVTGKLPSEHGIISNKLIDPSKKGRWCCDSRYIQKKTLWQAAKENKLTTASVLWPVTGYAKEINWNIPEIVIMDGENQIIENIKAGTVLTQLDAFLHHRHMLDGIMQPNLDFFATHVMCDIIKKKRPDFMLLHLTAFDTICHKNGRYADKTQSMLTHLDTFLGMILEVLGYDAGVIVFSDHAQLDVHTNIHPNLLLHEKGYLTQSTKFDPVFKKDKSIISDYRCFFHYAGGSAFFFEKGGSENPLLDNERVEIQQAICALDGVERLLTAEELYTSGFGSASALHAQGASFGLAAKKGWYFEETNSEKATHGYPLTQKNYKTFCAVNKSVFDILPHDSTIKTILDIPTVVAMLLNIGL